MVSMLVNYLMRLMTMIMNKLIQYKNPYYNQYIAPYQHHFEYNGKNLGRIIWINNPDGIIIVKDDD